MTTHSPSPLSGQKRAEYGVIITFENERGETLSGHRVGPPTRATRALCDAALALDPTYRVVSYSTPTTIMADLAGRKFGGHGAPTARRTPLPEAHILGTIGMRWMLHERLRGTSLKTERKDRTRLRREP